MRFVFLTALFLVFSLACASIPLNVGNLSIANVSKVYALVHAPDGIWKNVSLKNGGLGYQGFIDSDLAGVYNVTLFVSYSAGGILYVANTSKDVLFLNCLADSDCRFAGSLKFCSESTKQCSASSAAAALNSSLSEKELFLQVDASSPDFVLLSVSIGKSQTLEITASKGELQSKSIEVKLPVNAVPVAGAVVDAILPSGKRVSLKTLKDGTARIFLFGESGIVNGTVSAANLTAKSFSTETKRPLQVLRDAKTFTAFAASAAGVPVAVASGFSIFSLISSLAMFLQSLFAFRISLSQSQLGNIRLALQILSFSFLLLAFRKFFAILNLIGVSNARFELTYAVLEVFFFIAFFYALNKLGSSARQAANPGSAK